MIMTIHGYLFPIISYRYLFPIISYKLCWTLMQVFNDAIEALRVSYKKMNPFCVPFATTNMGSAILAMDLVRHDLSFHPFV